MEEGRRRNGEKPERPQRDKNKSRITDRNLEDKTKQTLKVLTADGER